MSSSLKIARISGIDLKLHATFLLVPVWGALQWHQFGTRGAVFGAVLSLCVFVCVALHELGHSVVAQAFGIGVKDITMLPIGGVARLAQRPKTPGQEFLISIAGPLVNVVIAGVLVGAALVTLGLEPLKEANEQLLRRPPGGLTLWVMLIVSNLALAVFNMVPALPMDGGRVLRAVLAALMGQHRATRAAATVGRVIATGFFIAAFAPEFFGGGSNPMLAAIGVFVFIGAGVEVRETDLQRVLEGIRAADAVNPHVPRFAPGTTVGEAMQALVFWPSLAFGVVHGGRLVGVVSREHVIDAANEAGPYEYVAAFMDREPPVIVSTASLDDARTKMSETGKSYVAVVEEGALLGLVTDAEIVHQVGVLEALQRSGRARRGDGALSRRA